RAVEGEAALGDAIGKAAGDRAEMRAARGVAFQRIEAEDDIGQPALSIGYLESRDDAAIGQDRDPHPGLIGQVIDIDRRSILGRAVVLFLHGRFSSPRDQKVRPACRPRTKAFGVEVTAPGRTTYCTLGIKVNQGAIWAR